MKNSVKSLVVPVVMTIFSIILLNSAPYPMVDVHYRPYVYQINLCVLVFFAALLLARGLNVLWCAYAKKMKRGLPPRIAQNMILVLIMVIAFTIMWRYVFNKPLSGILAFSGLTGLVLGVALRTLIMDLFMGLAINFDQPYKIGDFIMINKEKIDGQVVDINWRTTKIKTGESNIVIVPNSLMSSVVLTNFSNPSSISEMEIVMTFDFAIAIKDIKRILETSVVAVVGNKGFVKGEMPKIRIKAITSLGIEYKIIYLIDASLISPGKAKDLIMESVISNLQKSNVSFAYPKVDSFNGPMQKKELDYQSEKGRLTVIRQVDGFEQIDEKYLTMIASRMKLIHMESDQILFSEGDLGDSMYIVILGVLNVLVRKEDELLQVAQLTPGQFFGEMSMLTGEPRSATVRAQTHVIAYEISRSDLNEAFEASADIPELISKIMAKRQVANTKLLDELSEKETEQRVESIAKQLWKKIMSFEGLN